MGRIKLLYYALILMLFITVIALLSWWNSIEQELKELPRTGDISECGVVSLKASDDAMSWLPEIDLGSNYDRLYLKVTDNAAREVICPQLKYEVMIGKCKDELCAYSNTLKSSYTDVKGIVRLDSILLDLGPGEHALRLRQADTYYGWSSPVILSIDEEEEIKEEVVDLSSYLIYEQGDSFIFDSRSYLAKGEELDIPSMGTSRIDIESDTYWGDHLVRAWRILKDDSNLYWDPIPISQEHNGLIEDKLMRLMMVSPLYTSKDSRLESFNSYYWALGHKSYLRTEQGVMDLDPDTYYQTVNYTTSELDSPAMFFGQKTQVLPKVYLKEGSVKFYTSINESIMPSVISSNLPDRSFMLRVERESFPVVIGDDVYEDVIRLDMYEGGDIKKGEITYRESWYLAKGVGVIKIMVKYFDPSAFYGLEHDYPYIKECLSDADCLSDMISDPHLLLMLKAKQSIEELKVRIVPSSGIVTCNDDECIGVVDINTDNGAFIETIDNNHTGYVESLDGQGNISKIFYLTDGRSFLPNDFLTSLGTSEISFRFRISVPNEYIPSEDRVGFDAPWSNKAILRIIE